MLLQPIFEGAEDHPPALAFGVSRQGSTRLHASVVWVGLKFECSSVTARLHTNDTEFETVQIAWQPLEPGVYEEGVIFNVIQD